MSGRDVSRAVLYSTFTYAAYDGLFQLQKGWGKIYGP
jgi:hypothetical protein